MSTEYSPEYIRDLVPSSDAQLTGSRAICPRCVAGDSDHDYLVKVDDLTTAVSILEAKDFSSAGASLNDDGAIKPNVKFVSLRRGNLNLIITSDAEFFSDFMLATRVATTLGLTYRPQRITLFQAILYRKHLQ